MITVLLLHLYLPNRHGHSHGGKAKEYCMKEKRWIHKITVGVQGVTQSTADQNCTMILGFPADTDRQTDRQTDRHIDRQASRQHDNRHICIYIIKYINKRKKWTKITY